jgi:ATP-dependent Clp protease ATP-binding subunit ClpC
MFERFGEDSRQAVVLAQEEARRLHHHWVGTEHLLLGVLAQGRGTGAQSLLALGLTLPVARQEVDRMIGPKEIEPPLGHIEFTPRARRVIVLALREALRLGHREIATGHLLLALTGEEHGVAAQILVQRGITLAQVRTAVLERFGDQLPGADQG